ncbi:hypothetical protein EMCRGX_G010596 [Ephydatia muelleri]
MSALSSAIVRSWLEPTGLGRADASEVCAAANQAELSKIKKYSYLTSHAYHSFTPVAFETSGICGPRSMSFSMDLDHHIANTTGDKALWPLGGGMLHPFWELCLQPSPSFQ